MIDLVTDEQKLADFRNATVNWDKHFIDMFLTYFSDVFLKSDYTASSDTISIGRMYRDDYMAKVGIRIRRLTKKYSIAIWKNSARKIKPEYFALDDYETIREHFKLMKEKVK